MTAPRARTPARVLSLAAATAPADTRLDLVRHAVEAGFDAVGLRVDLDPPSNAEVRELRTALDDLASGLLDVEVVRLGTYDHSTMERVVEVAGALGAQHLLTVSDSDDDGATTAALAELAAAATERGVRVVVEFMRFTGIGTLQQAFHIVEATGDPTIGVLVDPLHLARSGGHPSDLAHVDTSRLAYVQLCDAAATPPPGGLDALVEEARHRRVLPGLGALPLEELLTAVPHVPVSVEVHDDEARSRYSPAELAQRVARHTRQHFGHLLS